MPDRHYWLVKSEPDVFSFDDLLASPRKTTYWNGVRNYAARIHLRAMKKGDLVFYYHSNATPSVIVGVAEVVKEAYPDPTALDPRDDYFDPKSTPDDPRWFMVDLKAVEKLPRPVSLDEIKKTRSLQDMAREARPALGVARDAGRVGDHSCDGEKVEGLTSDRQPFDTTGDGASAGYFVLAGFFTLGNWLVSFVENGRSP